MIQLMMALVLAPILAMAQMVDVKDVETAEEATTTIEIKKGKKEDTKPLWEVQDGTTDIEGEASPAAKDARQNWQKACNDWKKEFRADNKENKIINISCGLPTCGGEAATKTCVSKASYKIKTKLN